MTSEQLRGLKESLDRRMNEYLLEMKPNYDDSISGFNEAQKVVDEAFKAWNRRSPAPAPVEGVTEAMVERAARAYFAALGLNSDALHQITRFNGDEHYDHVDARGTFYVLGWRSKAKSIRAALEAALPSESAEKAGMVGWAAVQLAELVLSMGMVTDKGQAARQLARQVLDQTRIYPDVVAITTNGTTRTMPAAEPVFLIRGQDAVAGDAVRAWASLAEANGAKPDIVSSARGHAAKMDAWPTKKVPDLAPASPSPATGEA